MKRNKKFFNQHVMALDFTPEEQSTLDQTIMYAMETYLKTMNESASEGGAEEGAANEAPGQNPVWQYFNFGLNLMRGGMEPELVNELMEKNFQAIVNALGPVAETGGVRLQLSFVKNAVELLQQSAEKYFRFVGQLASADVPLDAYYESFQAHGLMPE